MILVSDVEAIAALLKRFLGLEERREQSEMSAHAEEVSDFLDDSSDSEGEEKKL